MYGIQLAFIQVKFPKAFQFFILYSVLFISTIQIIKILKTYLLYFVDKLCIILIYTCAIYVNLSYGINCLLPNLNIICPSFGFLNTTNQDRRDAAAAFYTAFIFIVFDAVSVGLSCTLEIFLTDKIPNKNPIQKTYNIDKHFFPILRRYLSLWYRKNEGRPVLIHLIIFASYIFRETSTWKKEEKEPCRANNILLYVKKITKAE